MLASDDDKDGAKTNLLLLDSVSQAIIILQRLERGATTQEILDLAGGEASIVRAHFLFFKQMDWAEQEQRGGEGGGGGGGGKWYLTEFGRNNLAVLKARWSDKPEGNA